MLPSSVTKEFVERIPKAELHLHLEGTLEPDLKLKLAERNGIDLGMSTVDEIKATYEFHDLPSFLKVYYSGMSVLQKEEDFYELAMAYFKNVQKQNVKYAEVFFDPQAHTARGISFDTVFNGYYRAIKDSHKFGVQSALIMCFLRDMSAESAAETLRQALPYKEKILGIGLDSDEHGNPPLKFKEVFKQAKKEGFHLTMHCDIDQENSIEHIRQVLMDIGVERIDHGTNIVENPKLVEYVKEHGIGLTACPVSNGFVVEDMKGKEIVELLEAGVKVTVNSDDPAYFQSYVADDLYTLSQKYQLTADQVVRLVKNAFDIAWLSTEEKNDYLKQVDDFISTYSEK